ncbi:SPOR domain-containing protein [Candidatus Palauibacter sp.]|uniref:SPOR domain-containing protein n=1 Tax=Candidatus Palauibacter sp. TaxID=3101350 RepID=UPI003AF20642
MTESDSFSWDLPGDARIVALVHESAERERSTTVVDAIATAIGRRREHTLVLSTEPGPNPLDELAGGLESEGWSAFFAGRARLTEVAVQRPDCPYLYLPAGRDPEEVAELLLDDRFTTFLDRVREREGTLFLVVSERTPLAPDLGSHLDGYVALGDVRRADSAEFAYYGRVRYEAADAGAASPEDETAAVDERSGADEGAAEEPDREAAPFGPETSPADPVPPRRRLRARTVVWLLVVAALLLGGWWLYRNPEPVEGLLTRLRSMVGAPDASAPVPESVAVPEPAPLETAEEAAEETAEETTEAAEPEAGAERADTLPDASPGTPPDSPAAFDAASAGLAFDGAAERPFSVLMGSHRDPADAESRIAELRAASPGSLFFAAPTPVDDVLYHRVFAGALGSEAEAAALLDALVRAEASGEANLWQLRPTRLAYDLGLFAERAAAEARIAELSSSGIPAYSLATPLEGRAVFRVYGGAYEDEQAALPMAGILEAAGEAATLVPRRGDETPSTS